ncbi:MAG: glycosyltransferase family 1 protein [Thaumarchaeota archaeon]|jgi:glycosyltransferase involved in cell wall biosynthesis|nr:MAG: glycosyltransferase family 1 protein [Nitrososphaerota archaeon]
MGKKLKICIFPNDPLIAYYDKGEIKDKYYNPGNFFDEVHFITLTDQDIESSKIQKIVGEAKMVIHSVGKINIKNRKKHLKEIIELCRKINPDVIRAFNPFVEGWLAANCAQKLGKPFFVSLHTQYDYNRKLSKNKLKKYLVLKYTEKFIEPFVLDAADKIVVVYKIIQPYVTKHSSKNSEVLHNKVDCNRFFNGKPISNLPQPLILSVGNLIPVKNHKILIKSMRVIEGHLLIIGNGELFSELNQLIIKYKIEHKVTIKKSVPNDQIQNYYKSAEIFALAYNTKVESLPIPVIEAMAAGLPIVIPSPEEGFSEGLENAAIFTKNNEKSFTENIQKLLKSKDLRKKYSNQSLTKAKEFDSEKIEKREVEIYSELIKGFQK